MLARLPRFQAISNRLDLSNKDSRLQDYVRELMGVITAGRYPQQTRPGTQTGISFPTGTKR